jgi:hypothetical protein
MNEQQKQSIQYYNPEEYTLEFKQFLYNSILDFFQKMDFQTIYYYELRRFVYTLNTQYISEIIKNYNLDDTMFTQMIVKQFSILFVIDRIYQENTFYQNYGESYKISYNGFYGIVNDVVYDCKNYPDGFYIIPEVINKKVIDRIYQVRFTMVNDFTFGDNIPGFYRCICDKVMQVLTDNQVAYFQKKIFLLDKRPSFQIQASSLGTEEAIFIFTTVTKLTFFSNGVSESLVLNPGSIVVLKRLGLYTTFQFDCMEKREQNVLIYA